jgi:hypothetical protein
VSYAAQDAGYAIMRSYDVGRDGKVFLVNNVYYLQYLDKGWSQQAPANFVAACFMGSVFRAPAGRKVAVRKMLRSLASAAYRRGN